MTRLIVSCMSLLLPAAAVAQADLDLALEAYYAFDAGDGADASDNGLDLTLFGGVGFEAGLFGQALAPNGDNNRYAARTVDDDSLDFGSGDFTVQAWVNYNDLSGEQILVEKFTGNSGPGWTLTKLSDNAFAFSADIGGIPLVRSEPQTIALDAWHHVAIRKDAGRYELFYDGALIDRVDAAASSASGAPLLVGRRNDTDGRDFALEGRIDEIAIWSRPLNDTEIAALWGGGQGRPVRILFKDGFEDPPVAPD